MRAIRIWLILIHTSCLFSGVPSNLEWEQQEIYRMKPGGLVFYMEYASAYIKNPEALILAGKNKELISVEIIFSSYPKKPEDWIRNYDSLLQARINAAIALDNRASDSEVSWKIIQQNKCNSDNEARELFHGLVFYYRNKSTVHVSEFIKQSDTAQWIQAQQTVENIVNGIEIPEDSLVLEVLSRSEFRNMLVVTDWTGSMYPYGAQVLLWQKMQTERNAVKGYIFFNDGNRLPDQRKRIGGTGGIFYVKSDSLQRVQKTMTVVAKLGGGGDIQENNLEAVWKGMRICKGWTDIVMIADNTAPVRDMVLLPKITVPVHIILCGVNEHSGIHPNYLEIARQTKGTIHLIDKDISNLNTWKEGEVKEMYGRKYKLKRGKIITGN